MAMETMMAAIIDHNHHHDIYGGGFTAFFDQDEEQHLLLEALDAEFAQELQFQEALRASLTVISAASPDDCHTTAAESSVPAHLSSNHQIPPGPDPNPGPEAKWEAGESSLRFCEVCKERKEDREVVRNVYDEDKCVCFGCINVNAASGKSRVKGHEKKPRAKQQHYKKKFAAVDGRSSPERANRGQLWVSKGKAAGGFDCSGRRGSEEEGESWEVTREKLKKAREEIRVLMDRIQWQHRESMEAMEFQEQFFRDQITSILEGKADDGDQGNGGLEDDKEM